MRIIPAVDILDNNVVRLVKGDFNRQTVYSNSPRDIIKEYIKKSFNLVHVVNLNGAKNDNDDSTLLSLVNEFSCKLQVAGGIKNRETALKLIEGGASRIVIGTAAAKKEQWVIDLANIVSEEIVIAIDINKSKVKTYGWTKESIFTIDELIEFYKSLGIRRFLITDIQKDGLEQGPNISLYKRLVNDFKINVIASGGVSSLLDIKKLEDIGVSECVIGKAIYSDKLSIETIRKYGVKQC
jgi:phosphoribosylformimino-5-aminoimidazole carboxamide ribotide isomerase